MFSNYMRRQSNTDGDTSQEIFDGNRYQEEGGQDGYDQPPSDTWMPSSFRAATQQQYPKDSYQDDMDVYGPQSAQIGRIAIPHVSSFIPEANSSVGSLVGNSSFYDSRIENQTECNEEQTKQQRSVRFISWFKGKVKKERCTDAAPTPPRMDASFSEALKRLSTAALDESLPSNPQVTVGKRDKGGRPAPLINDSMTPIREECENYDPNTGGINSKSPHVGHGKPPGSKKMNSKEKRRQKQLEKRSVGPPTEAMMQVRDKLLATKKVNIAYKVFRSLPLEVDSGYPTTPKRDLPCTQGIFREDVDMWLNKVRDYVRIKG